MNENIIVKADREFQENMDRITRSYEQHQDVVQLQRDVAAFITGLRDNYTPAMGEADYIEWLAGKQDEITREINKLMSE